MQETNPFVEHNVKIWALMGYLWPTDQRKLFNVIPQLLLSALMFNYLLLSDADIQEKTINAYYATLEFNCTIRVLFIMYNREKFEKFLLDMSSLYRGIASCEDPTSLATLQKLEFWAVLFSRVNWVVSFVAAIIYVSFPIYIGNRDLPYGIYIHGVDFKSSPAYTIGYIFEILLTPLAMTNYMAFVNMFVAFIFFGNCMIRILSHQFRTIAEARDASQEKPDNEKIKQRFRLYIESHQRVIQYIDDLNAITSKCVLMETIIFGILFLVLLFTVIVSSRTKVVIMASIYISMMLLQLFVMYYLSNEIIEESNRLTFAIYDAPWYTFNISNQKKTLIVMQRAQRPMTIMIGNVAPITMQTFQSILNVSYSYCNIMRGGMNNG